MSISTDTVIIKSKAYVNMLLHVLRFGSDDLDKKLWREVMGICVGKIENDQVVVYDAVAITHGKRVEVEYSENDYARVEILQEKFPEGQFIVGWYHSHPGMGPFLSDVDKANHFYWQNVNPKGIAIVWDHTLLADGIHDGFEIFRLTDLALAHKSDFHGVKYEVEAPKDKSIYRKFIDLANNVHREDPIMTEEGEIVDIFESMTLGTAERPDTDDLKDYVINNTTMILQTIRDLRKALGGGITRLQNWFVSALREGLAGPIGDLEIQMWDLTEALKNAVPNADIPEPEKKEPPPDIP
ncbi:MAG: Mov34/MPN/PAD-1 family protein [Promethearchaeota archaeon]